MVIHLWVGLGMPPCFAGFWFFSWDVPTGGSEDWGRHHWRNPIKGSHLGLSKNHVYPQMAIQMKKMMRTLKKNRGATLFFSDKPVLGSPLATLPFWETIHLINLWSTQSTMKHTQNIPGNTLLPCDLLGIPTFCLVMSSEVSCCSKNHWPQNNGCFETQNDHI